MHKKYQPIIGLEIHVELKTNAKMFCQCPADYFGKPPNTQTCPVCLGFPGALPVPNRKAIEWTQLIAKALNCQMSMVSKFDRKHYFYPDLPKGYQISQYDQPIAKKGWLKLKVSRRAGSRFAGKSQKLKVIEKEFRIRRVHIEEDTGKLIHRGKETLIDFNRSGVPLVEIVTEPDFDNSDDVKRFLEELQVLIRYLEVSDCDMEKGSMRLEPNISLQILPVLPVGRQVKNKQLPPYKVEIKNINSFRFVKQAIEYEIKRQSEILEKGITPLQETRGFDERKNETYAQRTKEEAHDYRYFPEPDIPPMVFSDEDIKQIEQKLPELPIPKDAYMSTREKQLLQTVNNIINELPQIPPQFINNFIKNKKSIDQRSIPLWGKELSLLKINPDLIGVKQKLIEEICAAYDFKNKINAFMDNVELVNSAIGKIVNIHVKAVQDYKKGKQNSIMFLVGQVMKELKGKADPQIVRKKLEEMIKSSP